jgi:hypothetical protein
MATEVLVNELHMDLSALISASRQQTLGNGKESKSIFDAAEGRCHLVV